MKILPFGLIWLVSGLVFLLVEQAVNQAGSTSESMIEMDAQVFIFSSIAITVVGLFVGVIETRFLDKAFLKHSFPRKFISKVLIYVALLAVVTMITYPTAAALELNTGITDSEVWSKFGNYLSSSAHWSTNLQLGVALILSLLYSEISDNLGRGILINFFTGKYHQPKEEDRIFMFMDMNSSTTIAENLGHIRYFELLREYYFDLTEPILDHSGEVYQYVGDEVVVSWKLEDGLQDNNCVRCFFAMKESLSSRAVWYEKEFGVVPSFKAGFHCGKVTTGEIGALKKEIIFTGDVLNTTARIQSLCAQFDTDILISSDLIEQLDMNMFEVKSFGKSLLKGRTEPVGLFSLC